MQFKPFLRYWKIPKIGRKALILRIKKKIGGIIGFRLSELLSGRQDSNLRPHAPQTCTLTGLSYAPRFCSAILHRNVHISKNPYALLTTLLKEQRKCKQSKRVNYCVQFSILICLFVFLHQC